MPDYTKEFDRLLAAADRLEFGAEKTALCEEAARLADSHHDVERGFAARVELTEAASFGGQPDTLLVAFVWLLAQSDRHPELFGDWLNQHRLLWRYKWVVGDLADYTHFTREKIDELFEDMRRRYRAAGATLHAYHTMREAIAVEMGDRAAARAAHRRLARTRRDSLSNCAACVQDGLIDYHAFLGNDEAAVAAGGPILDGGMTCTSVPKVTYAKLLGPLLRLGRVEEAMRLHRTGYPLVARKDGYLTSVYQHVLFLAQTDNTARALQIAEKHLPAVLAYPTPDVRRDWFVTLRFLFDRLRGGKRREVKLRLPPGHPLKAADDVVPVAKLFAWFDREARSLAAAFDARNGNDYFTRQIDGQADWTVTPHPYSAR
jgi:hypothetical protein